MEWSTNAPAHSADVSDISSNARAVHDTPGNICASELSGTDGLKPQASPSQGLIWQAVNQFGWMALLIDETGNVLWTSVNAISWIAFSSDSQRQRRWRRLIQRWWQQARAQSMTGPDPIGCLWMKRRLILTQWSRTQPDHLLVAIVRPSQLAGMFHPRWLAVLARSTWPESQRCVKSAE